MPTRNESLPSSLLPASRTNTQPARPRPTCAFPLLPNPQPRHPLQNPHCLQTHPDHLPDQPHSMPRFIRPLRIIHNPTFAASGTGYCRAGSPPRTCARPPRAGRRKFTLPPSTHASAGNRPPAPHPPQHACPARTIPAAPETPPQHRVILFDRSVRGFEIERRHVVGCVNYGAVMICYGTMFGGFSGIRWCGGRGGLAQVGN